MVSKKILKEWNRLAEMWKLASYSDEITERIPADMGVGMIFIDTKSEYNNKKSCWEQVEYKVKTFPKKPRQVYGRITSWAGISIGATHWYSYLDAEGLSYKYPGRDGTYSSNMQPLCTRGFEVEVRAPALRDTYSYSMYSKSEDGRDLIAIKGNMTYQFASKIEAYVALESEFNRIFGKGWILTTPGYMPDTGLQQTVKECYHISDQDIEDWKKLNLKR